MKIIAFDPGRVASYAILDSKTPYLVEVGEVDLIGSGRFVRPCGLHISELATGVDCAVVEEVSARPGQGVSSMFTFGMCTGAILNALSACAVPLTPVTPAIWKKSTRISSKNEEEVKTLARAYATELWPACRDLFKIKKNHGMAEAALMARWYFLKGPGQDILDDSEKKCLDA